jgi:hypothetical protein
MNSHYWYSKTYSSTYPYLRVSLVFIVGGPTFSYALTAFDFCIICSFFLSDSACPYKSESKTNSAGKEVSKSLALESLQFKSFISRNVIDFVLRLLGTICQSKILLLRWERRNPILSKHQDMG